MSKDGGTGGRMGEQPLMDGPRSRDGWAERGTICLGELSGSKEEEEGGWPVGSRVERTARNWESSRAGEVGGGGRVPWMGSFLP